ncbi:MAG TPA: ABC transporter permease [Dehalococcoidia bacterium]|jgi:ABC-type dipeptide/oligopeptide/nickel transport system permease subunit|nr:ABC transporter permease [Dehalococcoidia bacterium]
MAQESAIPAVTPAAPETAAPRRGSAWRGIWKFIRKKPLGAIGFAIVGFLLLATIGVPKASFGWPSLPDRPLGFELGSPILQRYSPEQNFYNARGRVRSFESPSSNHWLGTDKSGRDVWARIVNGARRSLFVAVWALVLATALGAGIGVVSGYFGKWMDTVIQRLMDALQSFPPLIALILIVTINPLTSGPNLFVIAIALGLVGIPSVQRIVRSVVLATREQQYVEAARTIGATDLRTMRYYIIPNIMASIIIVFSTGIGVAILAESTLGFIAPDKLPEGPSWGIMLSDAYPVIVDHPGPGLAAAGAIALAVLGFNLAGDALRDVLDPRLRLG